MVAAVSRSGASMNSTSGKLWIASRAIGLAVSSGKMIFIGLL